MMLKTLFWGCR